METFLNMFYLFFQGLLVFQTFFLLILYLVVRKDDILFYCLFLLLSTVYFFLNAPNTFFGLNDDVVFDSTLYRYLNIPIIILANLFYILFLRSYFKGVYSSPSTQNAYRIVLTSIPILVLAFFVLIALKRSNQVIFYMVNFLSFSLSIYLVVEMLRKNARNVGWVLSGMIFSMVGTFLTMLMIVLDRYEIRNIFTHDYPLFFMRCGILADILFYQVAIIKKWNYQEKQLALQQMEKELAVANIRNQISSQLHDDIGSTLSGISMYSYMTNNQLVAGDHEKAKTSLGIIQESANEMVDKLGDLVWSVNPYQDSLPLTVARLQEYGSKMAAAKGMTFKAEVAENAVQHQMPMKDRQNLYLIAKEAINNAAKYSDGKLIKLLVTASENYMTLKVMDDGNGFDQETTKKGNGLYNMQKRANEVGAEFISQSRPGGGCTISFRLKIAH
ncbi:MAG: ATP-binding protein [Bacteroidota bacterium]